MSLTPPAVCVFLRLCVAPLPFSLQSTLHSAVFLAILFQKSITFFLCCAILQAAVSRVKLLQNREERSARKRGAMFAAGVLFGTTGIKVLGSKDTKKA